MPPLPVIRNRGGIFVSVPMAQKNKKFTIAVKNEVSAGNTLELYFLDGIYDFIDWEQWSVVNLVEDVMSKVQAANAKTVVCWVNSEGGACDIGLAIYAYLKFAGIEVETRTLALAGSIASVIVQSASPGKRLIAKSAQMVIHKAWGMGIGNADDMRATADVLDGYTDIIVDIYVDCNTAGQKKAAIQKMIDKGDYWMSGSQAVEYGFADATFDQVPEGFSIQNSLRDLDEHYINVPDSLKPFTLNKTEMTIKERLDKIKADLKGKKPTNAITNDNVAEEVFNMLNAPLAEALAGIETDVTASVTNTLTTTFQTEIKTVNDANQKLTDQCAKLQKVVDDLVKEIGDGKGTESGKGENQEPKNTIQPIGFGLKAGVATA